MLEASKIIDGIGNQIKQHGLHISIAKYGQFDDRRRHEIGNVSVFLHKHSAGSICRVYFYNDLDLMLCHNHGDPKRLNLSDPQSLEIIDEFVLNAVPLAQRMARLAVGISTSGTSANVHTVYE